MQSLDYQVIGQAIAWVENGATVWLCTVLSTFGSSPREPGSLMVAKANGEHVGSLSGGCVEEDFLARLAAGDYALPAVIVRYGAPADTLEGSSIRLPCGGILDVLVERIIATSDNLAHLEQVRASLSGDKTNEKGLARCIRMTDGKRWLETMVPTGPRVEWQEGEEIAKVRIGPVAKLILAGYSTVAAACAQFAISLGYQVVLCDPREEVTRNIVLPEGVAFIPQLPSLYIAAQGACTPSTAVVAATHDPRIDDLAMMAAVKTPASYIGVMGSRRTSQAREERLRRTGELNQAEIERIHMPIGLDLGSKTPAEIALAIVADIVRVRRGRTLAEL
ncbi:XdhC family protein [Halomonas vilamensis]|uniref:XdhC family protein n=1 Tax=Vreelandella vilamensis TaxID=531309 RepID=A0ABU1H6W0_9GAMM|nr:XdhC family protein [Halomonas vilamensis]MDR5900038.1 XdhC family protein [Halomonas vilamensis]